MTNIWVTVDRSVIYCHLEDSKVKQTLREQWQTDLIPTSQAGWNWKQAVVSRSPFKDREVIPSHCREQGENLLRSLFDPSVHGFLAGGKEKEPEYKQAPPAVSAASKITQMSPSEYQALIDSMVAQVGQIHSYWFHHV